MVTPPLLPANIHDASHPRLGGPPHADVPEADADVCVAAPAVMWVTEASLAPRTYADGLRYNARPMRAGDVGGDAR